MRRFILILGMAGFLLGCAQTIIQPGDTTTVLSQRFFLNDHVPMSARTVAFTYQKTGEGSLDIKSALRRAIRARGYTLVKKPTYAHYTMQVTMRFVGSGRNRSIMSAVKSGVNQPIVVTPDDNTSPRAVAIADVTMQVKGLSQRHHQTRIGVFAAKDASVAEAKPALRYAMVNAITQFLP